MEMTETRPEIPGRRALSARRLRWQRMAFLAALLPAAGLAAPGGDIVTLPTGEYLCELPGDAMGPAGQPVKGEAFTIVNASSYRAGGAMGSYLLTGDMLTMTSGPKNGARYRRISTHFLRKLDQVGAESTLRCVRRTANNEQG